MTDWKLFVKLLLSMLRPNDKNADELADHAYVNSMITNRTPEKRSEQPTEKQPTVQFAPLSRSERHNNLVQQYNDLIDIINFTFLPGLGCIHLRAEWYLHHGKNDPLPEGWPNEENPSPREHQREATDQV